MKYLTEVDVRTKEVFIPKYSSVEIAFIDPLYPRVIFGNHEYKMSGRLVGKMLSGYVPDEQQIESWVFDSICETPTGDEVEPDGVGPDGVPSWLLLLGFV